MGVVLIYVILCVCNLLSGVLSLVFGQMFLPSDVLGLILVCPRLMESIHILLDRRSLLNCYCPRTFFHSLT